MRIDRDNNKLICDVAGHPIDKVVIGYSRHMCANITDGVSLANGEGEAPYVLRFSDLEQAYLEAKNYRNRHPVTADEKKLTKILGSQL